MLPLPKKCDPHVKLWKDVDGVAMLYRKGAGKKNSKAAAPPTNTSSRNQIDGSLSIRILSATLEESYLVGTRWQNGTFAKVHTIKNGTKTLVSWTEIDSFHPSTPCWDFLCRELPYNGRGSGDKIELGVYCNNKSKHFCGSVEVSVDELLGDDIKPGSTGEGPLHDLYLAREKKIGNEMKTVKTGIVTVKAMLEAKFTCADPDMFVLPVHRIDVSGGTAAFFDLKLRNPSGSYKSEKYFIGKDLQHAMDEILFYEDIVSFKKQYADYDTETSYLLQLLSFAFEYAGVLTAPEAGVSLDEPPKKLLVLRNLKDNCAQLRLLDLKIGHFTASAGWQGKTKARAKRQQAFDRITNSRTDGYRLEGFCGKPQALVSRMYTERKMKHAFNSSYLDDKSKEILHIRSYDDDKKGKMKNRINKFMKATAKSAYQSLDFDSEQLENAMEKADKVLLQTMTGEEIFSHFLDINGEECDDDINKVYSSVEFTELVMHEIVQRLTQLAILCHEVTVPQKWVGSSVALGYDCGYIPLRSRNEKNIRSSVIVNIFDWGRSELNTPLKELNLTDRQQENHRKYWEYYVSGIDRLSFAAAQTYHNRFGNSQTWKEITFTLYCKGLKRDHFLGKVTIPVQQTPLTECRLQGCEGTLNYSIKWRSLPSISRLKGSWRIFVERAENLPDRHLASISNPFCLITAVSEDDTLHLNQITTTQANTFNPVWNECIDLPVTGMPDALQLALENCSSGLGSGDLHSLFYSDLDISGEIRRSTIREWTERLQSACVLVSE